MLISSEFCFTMRRSSCGGWKVGNAVVMPLHRGETDALAVARTARDAGAGRAYRDEQLAQAVDDAIWFPAYVRYEPV